MDDQTWLSSEPLDISTADMNRLIMDYLITEGYREAAEKFRREANVEYPIENCAESLDVRLKIRLAIKRGDLEQAIRMINDWKPELLDVKKYLHFHLLQQQLIELIRDSRIEEALEFAQKNLAEKGQQNQSFLSELEQTMALLAFQNPEKSPFGYLLHVSQREKVATETNAALLECEHRHSAPKLETLIQLVSWAQDQLDKSNVHYPKMVNFSTASIFYPSTSPQRHHESSTNLQKSLK